MAVLNDSLALLEVLQSAYSATNRSQNNKKRFLPLLKSRKKEVMRNISLVNKLIGKWNIVFPRMKKGELVFHKNLAQVTVYEEAGGPSLGPLLKLRTKKLLLERKKEDNGYIYI